jgi:cellulose synthase/poly-beta-1,6-N-acetylglucosamine synthase-like glycosyltransferase
VGDAIGRSEEVNGSEQEKATALRRRALLHRRMTAAAQATAGSDYEFVLLNDGSSDRTWAIMTDLVRRDPHVVAVNLSRRHGHQLAITAGLYTCRGERILMIDADLPPASAGRSAWPTCCIRR